MAPSLEEQVSDLIIEARNLTKATKTRIRVFSLVIVFILVAVVGFGIAVLRANSALHAACETRNDYRKQDSILWNHVLDISGSPQNQTPAQAKAQQQTVAKFRVFLADHDKLIPC